MSTVAFHDRPTGASVADIETREIEEVVQSKREGYRSLFQGSILLDSKHPSRYLKSACFC